MVPSVGGAAKFGAGTSEKSPKSINYSVIFSDFQVILMKKKIDFF
jgi:hypothetical protein